MTSSVVGPGNAAGADRRSGRYTGASAVSVSIVVNNHNYGRFLRDAVDSALAQTHPAVEVIVVDDGSIDESRDILAGYGSGIRVVLKENGGQASALNAGFAASRGDLVIFLDADDVLYAEAAAETARSWRPGVSKVQFPLRVMDAEGRPGRDLIPAVPLPDGDVRDRVLRHGGYASPPTSGNAFAREALERLLPIPEEEWRRLADVYLIMLSPFLGRVASLARPLGGYRVHGANVWYMPVLDPEWLRDSLRYSELQEKTLVEWSRILGFTVPPVWRLRIPDHLKVRLASLRLQPGRHPYPSDRAWLLGLRGAGAALSTRGTGVRRRLAQAIWFLAAGLLPSYMAGTIMKPALLPARLPAGLRRAVLGHRIEAAQPGHTSPRPAA